MENDIRNYLNENNALIREEMEYAAKESFSISEYGGDEEVISVILTNNFKLKTITHPPSYSFPTYVLHVLHSFDCEAYLVDLDDVKNFLTKEQAISFEQFLLGKAERLLQLENEDLDDFRELSKDEKLAEVSYYISDECLLLELFKAYDEDLYYNYLKDIYDNVDTDYSVDYAMERMFYTI